VGLSGSAQRLRCFEHCMRRIATQLMPDCTFSARRADMRVNCAAVLCRPNDRQPAHHSSPNDLVLQLCPVLQTPATLLPVSCPNPTSSIACSSSTLKPLNGNTALCKSCCGTPPAAAARTYHTAMSCLIPIAQTLSNDYLNTAPCRSCCGTPPAAAANPSHTAVSCLITIAQHCPTIIQ
jgi:hypothetical protein